MPFYLRKRISVLPFLRLNLSRSGWSWTIHFGPWSWNTRSGQQSVDLPGPVNYRTRRRTRTRRTSPVPPAIEE